MTLDPSLLDRALNTLGDLLMDRGLRFELVAIGGSSLMLLGIIRRPTRDLDVVALVEDGQYLKARPLPEDLVAATRDVGLALGLDERWLNAGSTDLLDFGLPDGVEGRVETRRYGGLTLHLAGRKDQIFFKLYATADQGLDSKHAWDLRELRPTSGELLAAARWTRTHDPSEGFLSLLLPTLRAFGVEVEDGEL
jgi:hypothetical protein